MKNTVTYLIEQNAFSFVWIKRTFETTSLAKDFVNDCADRGIPTILE